jgi:hypothetical protein
MDEQYPTGTVVNNRTAKQLRAKGVPVRFGVVQAPEPTERVNRITDDDPASWRPAVDELVAEAWRRKEVRPSDRPRV